MSNNTRQSFSAIKTYTECGKKYEYHYKHRLRAKFQHAFFIFGSAVDEGLNILLTTKDVTSAKKAFEAKMENGYVNGVMTYIPTCKDVVYANADFDKDLLSTADWNTLSGYVASGIGVKDHYDAIAKEKDTVGFKFLTDEQKIYFNLANWLSLRSKGIIMIDSYNKKIMPKIKSVLAVQHKTSMTNEDGDEVVQYLDLIVKWEDGRILLGDNKTSARPYEPDSAGKSPQLISYHHQSKEEFKLDAVAFFVMSKNILKNKVKVCARCGFDGSGSRHKTCSDESSGKRCDGKWLEHISPECFIDVIINDVTSTAEDLVLSAFDDANEGIKAGRFHKNLGACKQGPIKCQYYDLCWNGSKEDLVKLDDV